MNGAAAHTQPASVQHTQHMSDRATTTTTTTTAATTPHAQRRNKKTITRQSFCV